VYDHTDLHVKSTLPGLSGHVRSEDVDDASSGWLTLDGRGTLRMQCGAWTPSGHRQGAASRRSESPNEGPFFASIAIRQWFANSSTDNVWPQYA